MSSICSRRARFRHLPAARVDDDFYADGSVRQIAPLSPALHLARAECWSSPSGSLSASSRRPRRQSAALSFLAQVAGRAFPASFSTTCADLSACSESIRYSISFPHSPSASQFVRPTRWSWARAATWVNSRFAMPIVCRPVRYPCRSGGDRGHRRQSVVVSAVRPQVLPRAAGAWLPDAMARRDEIERFSVATPRAIFLFPAELLR